MGQIRNAEAVPKSWRGARCLPATCRFAAEAGHVDGSDIQLSHRLDYSNYMIRSVYPLVPEMAIVKKIHLDIIEN